MVCLRSPNVIFFIYFVKVTDSVDRYHVYGPTRHTALRHPRATGVFPSGALPLLQPASRKPRDSQNVPR